MSRHDGGMFPRLRGNGQGDNQTVVALIFFVPVSVASST
jgi:hypothetical protein